MAPAGGEPRGGGSGSGSGSGSEDHNRAVEEAARTLSAAAAMQGPRRALLQNLPLASGGAVKEEGGKAHAAGVCSGVRLLQPRLRRRRADRHAALQRWAHRQHASLMQGTYSKAIAACTGSDRCAAACGYRVLVIRPHHCRAHTPNAA